MTFRDLTELTGRRQSELQEAAARVGTTVYAEVSPAWQAMLGDRPNFLAAERFNGFRNPATAAIYGVGGHKEDDDTARLFDRSIAELTDAQKIPHDVIAGIGEPLLGSPIVRPYRGNLFSTPFLNNIASAWRTAQFARRFCGEKPLRVCEIGAGFGATAQILHQILPIESYTIIDLPENLYMSSVFLPATLPGRSHQVVDGVSADSLACRHQLNFALPGFTDRLAPHPFDLVINRASMGEMTLATARAYIAWIRRHLADEGVFHFLNRFNVATAQGASCLSDFGLDAFQFRHIGPMERMTRPANQLHTEVVVSPARGSTVTSRDLDVVGDLFACGFDSQTTDMVSALLGGNVPGEAERAIEGLRGFFHPAPLAAKHIALASPDIPSDIAIVLRAAVGLLSGEDPVASTREAFTNQLGLKLEVRLRGLCAERLAAQGVSSWKEVLQPIQPLSQTLAAMAQHNVRNGSFTPAFKREFRITH